jgi:pSer/pThr/pTyr-binding forkhead associated (FHA) protein
MAITLDNLENRLQSLIEVYLVNLLPGRKAEDIVAQQLASAMKVRMDKDTRNIPGQYIVKVNPVAAEKWRDDTRLTEGLAKIMRVVAIEAGVAFDAPPSITIQADPTLDSEDVQITAIYAIKEVAENQAVQQTSKTTLNEKNYDDIPKNAFLIIGGVRVFPLAKSVINIGRRSDNDLAIDDPRVSRYHSQIRAIKGRFVLFDLNSTGGTFVNSQRANQTVLYPGDVISLAGLPVIFGQDNPPSSYTRGNTAPFPSGTSERPTAVLKKANQK